MTQLSLENLMNGLDEAYDLETLKQFVINHAPELLGNSVNTTATNKIGGNTACLSVTIKQLGTKRKADIHRVECEADKSMLQLGKTILECPELAAIQALYRRVGAYLKSRALPNDGFVKTGIWLIPLDLVEEVDHTLAAFCVEEKGLVNELKPVYLSRVAAAKARLRDQFNGNDYPGVEALDQTFGIKAHYLTLNVPEALKDINAQIWARESAKMEQVCAQALVEIQEGLRAGLAKMVADLVEALKPGAEGKKKKLYSNTVEKVTDFLKVFGARNLTGDGELAVLVEKAQALMEGVDVETLRKSGSARQMLQSGLLEVSKSLNALVQTSGRRYNLAEEAAE